MIEGLSKTISIRFRLDEIKKLDQIMPAALPRKDRSPNRPEMDKAMSGNIYGWSTYLNIRKAIHQAA